MTMQHHDLHDVVFIAMARKGSFTVKTVSGSDANQCGSIAARKFLYRAEIDGDSAHLTPEGFILDNFAVQRYFEEHFKHVAGDLPSCELMAMEAVRDLRAMCEGRASRIQVTVDGTGVAGLTARWSRGSV